MGKGDKKSRRGKLFQGSYGIKRRRKKDKIAVSAHAYADKPKPINEVITTKNILIIQ